MDRIKALFDGVEWMPFILATGQQVHLSIARILEALIIAAVTGGVVLWGSYQVLKAEIDQLQALYERDYERTETWREGIQKQVLDNTLEIQVQRLKSEER